MNMQQMQEFRAMRLTIAEHTQTINQLLNQVEELKIQIQALKPKRGRPRKNAE